MPKPHPAGSTFAERAAAAAGESSFSAPEVDVVEPQENTTFAQRAGSTSKPKAKQVDSDADDAENKAAASASTKRRAAKK